jgi:thiamine biosynthesis lipoprotein
MKLLNKSSLSPSLRWGLWALCLCAVFLGSSCKKAPAQPRSVYALGTLCTINLYDKGTDALYARLAERLNQIEAVFSVSRATSEIALINQNAGIGPVAVSEEVLYVLDKACYFAGRTNGAFDPAIGPLVQLWGVATDDPRVPGQEEIGRLLPLVDYRKISYDMSARTVFLSEKGMALDLGAIAKGYAADELVKIIAEAKLPRALIDLGGNVYVYGRKPDKTAWRVGVKNPEAPDGEPAIRLDIDSSSVVTSGAYERFFMNNGRRYHHILDPKTGYPAQSGVLSSTIVSQSSLAADALSTSAFVLGQDKALALFAEGFQDAGITAEALLMGEDHMVRATKNLAPGVTLLSADYGLSGD